MDASVFVHTAENPGEAGEPLASRPQSGEEMKGVTDENDERGILVASVGGYVSQRSSSERCSEYVGLMLRNEDAL